MKMITIMLDQAAIEDALTRYIGETTLGVDLSDKNVDIKLIAGRKKNGLRAEVSISAEGETPEPEVVTESPDTPEPDEEVEQVVSEPDFSFED
jgi:hypothetical protein